MQSYNLLDLRVQKGKYWPTVEACYSQTWNSYKMAPHIHERSEIMYVLKGKCLIHLFDYTQDTSSGEIHVLHKHVERLCVGEFIFLDRGVLHALEVPETSYMANAEFAVYKDEAAAMSIERMCVCSDAFRRMMEMRQPFIRGVDREGKLYESLSQVINGFSVSKITSDEKALQDLYMGQLLLSLAQELRMAALGTNGLTYVRKAIQLLTERLQEDIKVADIADEIGIAPSYLQRLFKQIKGITMIEYLNSLRIERSKVLLAHTQYAIVDIAIAVGYNSRQHFCRVFTKETGVSPQKYRQSNRNYENKQLYHFEDVHDLFVWELEE